MEGDLIQFITKKTLLVFSGLGVDGMKGAFVVLNFSEKTNNPCRLKPSRLAAVRLDAK